MIYLCDPEGDPGRVKAIVNQLYNRTAWFIGQWYTVVNLIKQSLQT